LASRQSIAATDHMSGLVMEPLSRALAQSAPGVNLYLLPVYRDTMDRLRDGSLDLAMGAFPSHPPDVLTEAVFLDRYVCVLRKGHPALRKRLDVRAYAALEHLLIAPQGVPVGRIDHELRALGHERRVARTVPHFHLAPRIVARSDYVVTMSLRVARDAASRFPLAIVDLPFPLPEYPLKQLWHRRHEADPALAWLRAQITAIGAALPALDGP
jgi:DNA-binding transcriptional LysR family regulator